MNSLCLRVTFGLVATFALAGQTIPTGRPQFAVASVKPSRETCVDTDTASCTAYGLGKGRGYGKYVTLKRLIGLAWQVQQFQITGGPAWAASARFEVEGKSEDPNADLAQLRLMLRSLLEDRFMLKVHRDTRESPVYALVVAKGGPKIKWSSDQTSPDDNSPSSPGDSPNHGGILMGTGMLVGNGVPLDRFARVLSPQVERFVVDRTNLTGRFDIQLRWTPDVQLSTDTGSADAPSIFTAVQEQLGLKLEPAKGPVEVLIIDHAEKPSQN